MITVADRNQDVWGCLGAQSYAPWKKYRELPYTLKCGVPEGMLWYNLLTREIVLLTSQEAQMARPWDGQTIQRLVQRWYLVPADIDARTLVYGFWQRYNAVKPVRQGGSLRLVTIFTTTECNARCPYCYEYGTAKATMSMEVADAASDYIIKNSAGKLMVKWFGGEPLLNCGAMDHISRRIGNSGREYSSYIVSNGYLFDQVSDRQIKDLWKARQVQITIDGTREEYLRAKGLPGDAYEKVLGTVERLAGLGVNVMLRSHATGNNAGDLGALARELGERFRRMGEKGKLVHLYVAPLFEGLGKEPQEVPEEQRKRIYDDIIALDGLISSFGLGHARGIPKVKQSHCMADNGRSIVITPSGDLTPCEHCHDREIIGNVADGGAIPQKWLERTPEIPECAECFYYPQCVKLKMCEAEPPCNRDNRRLMMYQAEQAMLGMYRRYKSRRERNAESTGHGKG